MGLLLQTCPRPTFIPYDNGFPAGSNESARGRTETNHGKSTKRSEKQGRQAAYLSQIGSIPLFHNTACNAKSSTSPGAVTDRCNRFATTNWVWRTLSLACRDDESWTWVLDIDTLSQSVSNFKPIRNVTRNYLFVDETWIFVRVEVGEVTLRMAARKYRYCNYIQVVTHRLPREHRSLWNSFHNEWVIFLK